MNRKKEQNEKTDYVSLNPECNLASHLGPLIYTNKYQHSAEGIPNVIYDWRMEYWTCGGKLK